MSSKTPSYLLWDINTCPSPNVDVIQSIISTTGFKFSNVLIYTEIPKALPSGVNDLAIALNCIIRFGEYSLYDIIADLMSCITSKKKFNIAVISTRLSVWLTILEKFQPETFYIFSSVDPRDTFDFSFLPSTIPTKIYQWPSLALIDDDVSGASEVKEDSEHEEEEEPRNQKFQTPARVQENDDEEENEQEDEINSSMMSPSLEKAQTQKIQQQNLLESNKRLNFKSSTTKDILDSPQSGIPRNKRRSGAQQQNEITISAEFRPLIEAMKSVGKSMVALNDFEAHLKQWAVAEGVKCPDAMSLIQGGVDAGIVIFDQTINYIRFRNRSIPTGHIIYE